MSLPYIEENFISSDECQRLIDFAAANKKENISQDDVYSTEIEWIDHGATYYGNNVDPVTAELDDDAVIKVTEKCKTFADCELIYAGVVRWPVGTFMKPHFDTNTGHKENILAAMLYLNNDFDGGNLIFKDLTSSLVTKPILSIVEFSYTFTNTGSLNPFLSPTKVCIKSLIDVYIV